MDIQNNLYSLRFASDFETISIALEMVEFALQEPCSYLHEFNFLTLDKTKEIIPNFLAQVDDIYCFWQSVLQILDDNPMPSSEIDSIQDVRKALCIAAENRLKRFKHISHIVSPRAMPYVPHFTSINRKNIGKILNAYLDKCNLKSNMHEKLNPTMRAQQIIDFVADLREEVTLVGSSMWYELEALEGALLYYFDKVEQSQDFYSEMRPLSKFVYCRKCWRMLSKNYAERQSFYCDLHNPKHENHTSTMGRKSKAVTEELWKEDPVIPSMMQKYFADLNTIWKPNFGKVDYHLWDEVLHSCDVQKISKLPSITYDMGQVWQKLPNMHELIKQNGVNLTAIMDILTLLNPPADDETEREKELRHNLHSFFCKNFWFYRLELAFAEAVLSQEHHLFAHRTHGGKRKNSGGKRYGAGRPRKSRK